MDTYDLGCDGVDVVLATYGAVDIPLLFDHGRSVAGPGASAQRSGPIASWRASGEFLMVAQTLLFTLVYLVGGVPQGKSS